jgi:proteasome lid subunit RPN8/RPN11
LGALLAIIVEFPVMTPDDKPTSFVDTRAFVPSCKLGDLGVAIGALFPAATDQGSQSGYAPALVAQVDERALEAIQIEVANVHIEFDQERAAELAGLPQADKRKVVMVGAGAIGSQMAMILAREGRFTWTVVDDDRLLPHNLARHSLEFRHLGQPKAAALCDQLNGLRPPSSAPSARAILCNVLSPGEHEAKLNEVLNGADVVIDASASVAAARFLSDHTTKARRVSTFFNPAGEAVVVLVEPADRHLTLRDLEAQYYRAVLRQPELERHLSATGERFAYTGACRALTNRIPQSRAALLSSLGAASLSQMLSEPTAGAGVWTERPNGSVVVSRSDTSEVFRAQRLKWTITIDKQLTEEIIAIRARSLPVETGGVLLGVVDAAARSIHIVDALSAPPDSVEQSVGFERGIEGLEKSIRDAMVRTMDQIRYVGEWHSHPPRTSIAPSDIDVTQIAWLSDVLSMENRPGVMLIAGDAGMNLLTGEIFA